MYPGCLHTFVDRLNGTHECHAQSGQEHIRYEAVRDAHSVAMKMKVRLAAEDVEKTEQRTDALRKDGRRSRAADAQPERSHEEIIQHNVQHAAEKQEEERRDAVADGLHHVRFQIIRHRQRNAREDDGQVAQGAVADIGGDLHGVHQPCACGEEDHGHHQRTERGEQGHPADGTLHALFIARTEMTADGQRKAAVQAEGKRGDQAVQRGG